MRTQIKCTSEGCTFKTWEHEDQEGAMSQMADHLEAVHGIPREEALAAFRDGRVEGVYYQPICPRCGKTRDENLYDWTPSKADPAKTICDACHLSEAAGWKIGSAEWPVGDDPAVFDTSEDDFRKVIAEGAATLKCEECDWTAPYEGEHIQTVEFIRHYVEEHGKTEDEARRASVHVTWSKCPRCKDGLLKADGTRNALSRTDNETEICEACGTDESIEATATGRVTPRSAWPVPGRHVPERHGFQSPDWRDQRSNRAHRPNPMPVPKELPDLRLHLMERWVPGGIFDGTSRLSGQGTYSPEQLTNDTEWERQALRKASLWWIKGDMVDLVTAAAASIPEDITAGEIDLPAEQAYGLAVLQRPWYGLDADNEGEKVEVNAIVWGPARVDGHTALTFSMYRYLDFAGGLNGHELQLAVSTGLINEAKTERVGESMGRGGTKAGDPTFRLYGGAWAWLGRSDWQLGETLKDMRPSPSGQYANPFHGEWDTPLRRASIEEDRRWFASLCFLVNHRLSETEAVRIIPHTTRKSKRAREGKIAPPSTVRIIRLRQTRHETDETGEPRKVEWSHRWMVGAATGGMWAWRRCGPKRSQRKLVFIAPYIKGPADKELVLKENVRVWVK